MCWLLSVYRCISINSDSPVLYCQVVWFQTSSILKSLLLLNVTDFLRETVCFVVVDLLKKGPLIGPALRARFEWASTSQFPWLQQNSHDDLKCVSVSSSSFTWSTKRNLEFYRACWKLALCLVTHSAWLVTHIYIKKKTLISCDNLCLSNNV